MITKRQNLFFIQLALSIIMLFFLCLVLYFNENYLISKPYKIFFSPFGAVSILLMLLFWFNDVVRDFPDGSYDFIPIIINLIIVILLSYFSMTIIQSLFKIKQIEVMLFFLSILLCVQLFIGIRRANIWTMSIITGLSEGIVLYMVFIY